MLKKIPIMAFAVMTAMSPIASYAAMVMMLMIYAQTTNVKMNGFKSKRID